MMSLSVMYILGVCQVYILHTQHVIENSSFYKTLCSVSPSCAKQIIPILFTLCYNSSLVTWMVVSLTAVKLKPLIILCVWLCCAVLCCEYGHSHDFVWPLLVSCTVLLYNHIYTEGWKPCANHRPVCTLENLQWCGEPCFVGPVILSGGCLPQIPSWASISHYWSNQCFMEG
jgi:hypothetical protein